MKNSNNTMWDRTSDLPICSALPKPLCHGGPYSPVDGYQFNLDATCYVSKLRRNEIAHLRQECHKSEFGIFELLV
jgi:hypothetical protein